jgi:peptidoglycan/LPS O-acetylase OafA/YrhL
MFFTLLLVTFAIAVGVSFVVVRLFDQPVAKILDRIVTEELGAAWHRYIKFAAYVVGISGGVRIYQLERYISAPDRDTEILVLNTERWTLEVYRTVIETLQSMAWMFLVVFVVALLAYVLVRGFELRQSRRAPEQDA